MRDGRGRDCGVQVRQSGKVLCEEVRLGPKGNEEAGFTRWVGWGGEEPFRQREGVGPEGSTLLRGSEKWGHGLGLV